jgi:hypothetical protein
MCICSVAKIKDVPHLIKYDRAKSRFLLLLHLYCFFKIRRNTPGKRNSLGAICFFNVLGEKKQLIIQSPVHSLHSIPSYLPGDQIRRYHLP